MARGEALTILMSGECLALMCLLTWSPTSTLLNAESAAALLPVRSRCCPLPRAEAVIRLLVKLASLMEGGGGGKEDYITV